MPIPPPGLCHQTLQVPHRHLPLPTYPPVTSIRVQSTRSFVSRVRVPRSVVSSTRLFTPFHPLPQPNLFLAPKAFTRSKAIFSRRSPRQRHALYRRSQAGHLSSSRFALRDLTSRRQLDRRWGTNCACRLLPADPRPTSLADWDCTRRPRRGQPGGQFGLIGLIARVSPIKPTS